MSKRRFPLEKVGLWITAFYLALVFVLVCLFWGKFRALEPNAWGDFLAGTIGPLALGWIVLGFFLQSRELQHSVDALRLQAEELKNSVEQQKVMVRVSQEQLGIETETRDRIAAQEKETLRPNFELSFYDRTQFMLGGNTSEVDLYLKNLGGPAFTVSVFISHEVLHVGSLAMNERAFVGKATIYNNKMASFTEVRARIRCENKAGEVLNFELQGFEIQSPAGEQSEFL